ncbi:MAG: phosphohydrolase [Candidatus Doudnabacteria bacterium RIFCSPLOWO2_02_FULL_42_9]|uniref:Phosphohydrolase n=1 Tax=Candidatus Doudnabacteria bacterium RIFCSPHIGHO2_01_FULL_41_86 TaxID=1817821 RepID=A0A1F5N8X8_9BACT|nr:MAG: phosphohydrolase [Candidatus Doudnabacteria bacterium RIFCSPHIGHO2_01_FULL_41_86]OGE75221.1 MAG: phosphohydrolase [Candidatus Doudnabacteria bacterium RIFCSPHIGHO2_01_43_10]OGE92300.1 MAG: phosphohydrolase [Candidatus Doudnabacteria bacterium RIFCSPLOWO2_01_FULL_42_60]OGE99640.1 MAG: phosphohydrolase [Candidatus Doudnabacteria bacterium RIFCSPLOWO2_12_FULL_42_9]OGF00153.1 MAG: phosphohydrolase [Candidatus Doudnabacteria bacterium RIFCSPLOWO2_02_FULL_42_9]
MNKKRIIKETEVFVKKSMIGDPGHDWTHVDRVRKWAMKIGKVEKADLFIVELAALLHDVADYKFHKGDDKLGGHVAVKFLKKFKLNTKILNHIENIVNEVSFKGAGVKYKMKTIEGKVVQDADKLDALGAIGIARTFSFGGKFNVPMYIPKAKPFFHRSFKQYKKLSASTVNHFYEKLLLLKDRMHTKTAKRIAQRRHKFMEQYLKEFYREWKLRS